MFFDQEVLEEASLTCGVNRSGEVLCCLLFWPMVRGFSNYIFGLSALSRLSGCGVPAIPEYTAFLDYCGHGFGITKCLKTAIDGKQGHALC